MIVTQKTRGETKIHSSFLILNLKSHLLKCQQMRFLSINILIAWIFNVIFKKICIFADDRLISATKTT